MSNNPSSIRSHNVPRSEAGRLLVGRGRFIDNIRLPRMLHLAFVRSPVAHATLNRIETEKAGSMPGVAAVITAAEYAPLIAEVPQTKLDNFPNHNSPPQPPLVEDHIRYQGEPVAIVAAETLAQAEEAAAIVSLDYKEMPAMTTIRAALAGGANIASEMEIGSGIPKGDEVVRLEAKYFFARQTGVTLEPRGIVADYDELTQELTVWQPHQSPHLVQVLLARILGMQENKVRVQAGDVGGGFGVKLHLYADEIATVLSARLLGRPVKYLATRTESFQSDVQAREFEAVASISFTENGELIGMEGDFNNAIGAYSIFPRSSIGDSVQAAMQLGAPYKMEAMHGKARTFWQHKPPSGAIRGVGQPIPCTVTEQLMDMMARYLRQDPAKLRRRHYLAENVFPLKTLGGIYMDRLSLKECLDFLLVKMSYSELRVEQEELRSEGILRGIGIATFVEQTAVDANLYGVAGVPATSVEECRIRVEADGSIRVETGATDQGQGTLTGIGQIVAQILGLDLSKVHVVSSDSAGARGGGAWASRGLSLAGEAAAIAAEKLLENILELAGSLLQVAPRVIKIEAGSLIGRGDDRLSLADLAKMVWYQPYNLPDGATDLFAVSRSYTSNGRPHFMANGIQGSLVEVDADTGKVHLLKHWVVEDCGNLINPKLVEGQIMGGAAQGMGAALGEDCHYDDKGQLLSGSLLDYMVPRADDLPPIDVHHVTTPQTGTKLGVKGVGEAGTIGAPAAIWSAVNDAIFHLGARVIRQPITPESVFKAISEVD